MFSALTTTGQQGTFLVGSSHPPWLTLEGCSGFVGVFCGMTVEDIQLDHMTVNSAASHTWRSIHGPPMSQTCSVGTVTMDNLLWFHCFRAVIPTRIPMWLSGSNSGTCDKILRKWGHLMIDSWGAICRAFADISWQVKVSGNSMAFWPSLSETTWVRKFERLGAFFSAPDSIFCPPNGPDAFSAAIGKLKKSPEKWLRLVLKTPPTGETYFGRPPVRADFDSTQKLNIIY